MFMPIASLAPSLDKRWSRASSAISNPLLRRPQEPRWAEVEPLDQGNGFQGMGRSHTFPFREWRDSDEHRTVFFDEGAGHPLVFVHGLGGNATHFEFLLGDLVRSHRVVGLDLVGCGWTRKPDRPYTVSLLKDHLLSFLDRRGIGKATLVGHSLGGAVCMSAALERPGQFESLALLCAAGVAPLPRWMRAAAPLFLRRSVLLPTLALGADFIVDNVFVDRAADNPHVQWFRDSAMRDDPGYPNLRAFARVCETLCRDVVAGDFSERLASLHMPVLGVWGDADKLTCRGGVMRNLASIRHVRTVVLRRCGHMPMIERPAETLFHLRRFLDSPP
ncbi:MAG: alpha/beta fold hydrolase [Deltaproteobacteria bacterium]|jgi:4,5:9,10-diseco-3-hydroxy-5,9,17-trioxoandrosta-1(10),2-diene-4-oate hydrolase|nr:alpha/beta fold hydrolase [Deltaproteobacteria bacterium]MBW2533970.1 alpha/beta fold hydrolase [Deltaproteobacteria bacterium]